MQHAQATRSPLRLLEEGLHGGLGAGNLGLVMAGPGVGKTSFLVGVALDALLRKERVLHIALDQTLAHTRNYYETIFFALLASAEFAASANAKKPARADAFRHRVIHALALVEWSATKLEEIFTAESESGGAPALVIVEGADARALAGASLERAQKLAANHGTQFWFSLACAKERKLDLPSELAPARKDFSVILALEPGANEVVLRAIKDHENANTKPLHVTLDPQTLLLKSH